MYHSTIDVSHVVFKKAMYPISVHHVTMYRLANVLKTTSWQLLFCLSSIGLLSRCLRPRRCRLFNREEHGPRAFECGESAC